MTEMRDDFDAGELDTSVWFPHYLPAWSSRSATRATYEIHGSNLTLAVPNESPLWCPNTHEPPLRVSGMASGNWSGPAGSTRGQQRFSEGLVVQEAQERFEGWLQDRGRIATSCRMTLSPRSMAALWLSGFEEHPDESGELCVVEVFGKTVTGVSADVGVGVKQLYDQRLDHDFIAPALPIDVSQFHEYAVTWDPEGAEFSVDGEIVHRTATAPAYPMQIMIGVFDFPSWTVGDDDHHVPELEIDWVAGDTSATPVR